VDYCAVLTERDGGQNFLMAILPRNQAADLCRQCNDAAQRLKDLGYLKSSVSHRLLDVDVGFPLFVLESRSWNRNFFTFHDKQDIVSSASRALPVKREVVVYKVVGPFSFQPFNDIMGSLPHINVGSHDELKNWVKNV
jgi:hypothetical protein